MNLLYNLCLLGCLSMGSANDPPIGVFVRRDNQHERIEFFQDARFIRRSYNHKKSGRYTIVHNEFVCPDDDEIEIRFRWTDTLLIDQNDVAWVSREALLNMPWDDVSPVTLIVLNQKTGEPVTQFTYDYTINTPKAQFDPLLVTPIEVNSKDGSFVLIAPSSCEIKLAIKGGSVLGGYGSGRICHLTSDNKDRRLEVHVGVGITIKGVVVDAASGQPIKDASIAPTIFIPPLTGPDWERVVLTDNKGQFSISGVNENSSISVWHCDYLDTYHVASEEIELNDREDNQFVRIEMEAGDRLLGIVKDPFGRPLSNVEVSDGESKSVRTDANGQFDLRGPSKYDGENFYYLTFEKKGYLDAQLEATSAAADGFAVVMYPQPELNVIVLDSDGSPVANYSVSAGVGLEPRSWSCSIAKPFEVDGRSSLSVDTDRDYEETGKVWVGVNAPGFAFWETSVDIWQGSKTVTARLEPGLTVYGSVAVSEDRSKDISVEILPHRVHRERGTSETSQRQEMMRAKSLVDSKGNFRLTGLAAGSYTLAVSGPCISPMSTDITVFSSDVDAGKFTPKGRGNIKGIAFRPGQICDGDQCTSDEKPGAFLFEDGFIHFADNVGLSNVNAFKHFRPIPFKTDEFGQFDVEGVPTGTVSVCFPYHMSADIIGAHCRKAIVIEGNTTEARFFDATVAWDVTCEVIIGNGSEQHELSGTGMFAVRRVDNIRTRPRFLVDLIPLENWPASYSEERWYELDGESRIVLRDVHPGRYRLVITDLLLGSRINKSLLEMNVDVKSGGTKINIPLGAGAIVGAIRRPGKDHLGISVLAFGKSTQTLRHAYCEHDGGFYLRYLNDDDYVLFAHSDEYGWCQLPDTKVSENSTYIGAHKLAVGGSIVGRVPASLPHGAPFQIEATDSNGITVKLPVDSNSEGKEFSFKNLWPSKWIVRIKLKDEAVVEGTADLIDKEVGQLDFDKR